ncbi:MAG: cytochrome c biogenesis protein CcdA [Magnetococcales bacterium]|nr:cytochrome c biogenesis protein CcdA [Magnetococcales bacterium]MBF0152015.1 cytochrome c biogenesis protein CcdA [Magnetococcales bacterium]MBF0349089.1 cytochrome c biogenesis protein CcdA [Magnetococcales bacterium]
MMEVSFATAVAAGFLSFISPCVLPLVPAYISYMSGISVEGLRDPGDARLGWRAGITSLFFVLGFSTVFILMGASATALGSLLQSHVHILSKVGGVLIVLFGLHAMGVFRIGLLNLEARFNEVKKPAGLMGAYVIGLAFAFGWTPCVGPILAAILALAGGRESIWEGIALLASYSAGLGLPFILAGLATHLFFRFFQKARRYMQWIEWISGLFLVVVGVMIFFGDFNRLSILLLQWFPFLATVG